jgi:NADH-ubiquinone oxidoreductase chain 3
MTSPLFFFSFVIIVTCLLLAINIIFAVSDSYLEKNSVFECGFHSFLGQNRSEFLISFYLFALLYLLFDLEILLIYPYIVSSYVNSLYGLIIILVFILVLTVGFVYELAKKALSINSKQTKNIKDNKQRSEINLYKKI